MEQTENESSISTIIHHYTNIDVLALILKTGHCAMNGMEGNGCLWYTKEKTQYTEELTTIPII